LFVFYNFCFSAASEGSVTGISGAQDFALENVTVHSAPCVAFFFDRGGRVRISNCTVYRSDGKWICSAADAVHFNASPGDVLIENSRFAFQGDDGMNFASGT
jgi:polygalacturonase